MVWLFLIGAIVFEVVGTLSLRMAVDKKRWYIGVAVGYVLAFTSLSLALAGGMALGVAYGIWAASGVALTAVLSKFLFKEPFTWLMGLGIVLIVGGVSPHRTRRGSLTLSLDRGSPLDRLEHMFESR